MEPNQNPPSEHEWTTEERERFFVNLPKQPPIEWYTGAWNGPIQRLDPDDPFGDLERLFSRGIHVTAITPPEQGWPIAMYCPLCHETTFILSYYAAKPEKGDYWRMTGVCGSETLGAAHNMQIALDRMREDMLAKMGQEL